MSIACLPFIILYFSAPILADLIYPLDIDLAIIQIFILAVSVQLCWQFIQAIFIGKEMFLLQSIGSFFYGVSLFISPSLVIIFGLTIDDAISVVLISVVFVRALLIVLMGIFLVGSITDNSSSASISLEELTKYGKFLGINNTVKIISESLDRYFIVGLLGANALASYSIALQVVQKVTIPFASTAIAIFPGAARRDISPPSTQ